MMILYNRKRLRGINKYGCTVKSSIAKINRIII